MSRGAGWRKTRTAVAQRVHLTGRERQVLALAGVGLNDHQIAARLSISHHTVVTYLHNTFTVLKVHRRQDAIDAAKRKGLLKGVRMPDTTT